MPRLKSAIFASLVSLLGASLPVLAQELDAWTTNCTSDGKNCTISRTVHGEDVNIRAATLLAVVNNENSEVTFGAIVPLGLSLQPGMQMRSGEVVISLPYDVCFPDGCRALKALSLDELEEVLQAEELDLRFFVRSDGTLVSVPVPMSGFPAALTDARERLSQ